MTIPAIRSYRGTTNSAYDNMFGCSVDEAKAFKGAHSIASFGKFRDQTDLNNTSALTPMQITNTWKKNLSVIGNDPEKPKSSYMSTETFDNDDFRHTDGDKCPIAPIKKMHDRYHAKVNAKTASIVSIIVAIIIIFAIVMACTRGYRNRTGALQIIPTKCSNCVL